MNNTEIAQPTEIVRTIKNFRSAPDIENFYRFVHENDLRFEARKVLELVVKNMIDAAKKKNRKSKKLQ